MGPEKAEAAETIESMLGRLVYSCERQRERAKSAREERIRTRLKDSGPSRAAPLASLADLTWPAGACGIDGAVWGRIGR